MSLRFRICALILMLCCASAAKAATFCVTSGNQLNIALETAGFNSEHDTIKIATGTHITDYHAPGAPQWSFEPATQLKDSDYEYNLTVSGGWNAANNCQTQITLDPAQTVLDARYWGPVFAVTAVFHDFTGNLHFSNLTFYRGESNEILGDAAMRVIVGGGPSPSPSVTFDNILVSGNRSGAAFASIGTFSLGDSGTLKIRNSQFLNNSFTHASSGGLSFGTNDGAIGIFTNNSMSGNASTDDDKGLFATGLVTLSNNAIGDNPSTQDPSYDFLSNAPTQLTLTNNHFQTKNITNGAPASETNTTTGDPAWSLVVARMVPDAVSPLRDSGNNTPTGDVPNIDFSGQPRIVNVTIDRGAVEADAPPASEVGPLITAVSPANGSTTVFQGPIGSGFVGTQLTFDVSGGVAPGVTELECSETPEVLTFGMTSAGGTVGVGGSITPIDVGFDDITSEPQTATVTCAVKRELAGTSYLTFHFMAVPPGGPAEFDSDPDPSSTIDLTPDLPAIAGSDVFTKSLKLYNIADIGDSDMVVTCDFSGGSNPPITASPDPVNGESISPQGVLEVVFDCDTSTPGSYSANYSCTYDLGGVDNPNGVDPQAEYTVECDVRPPPQTHVETTPEGGVPTYRLVDPGGSASYEFLFEEVSPDPDPPADAFLQFCSFGGTDPGVFSIDSPAFPGGPYPIVNGAPQTVRVTGTDDGSKFLYSATLNCIYNDTINPGCADNAEAEPGAGEYCGATVIFPLVLQARGPAKFRVIKDFTDGLNPTEVEVTISCNTGLPIEQSQTISETQDVVFVVESFDPGEMDCTVSEVPVAGYDASYSAQGDSAVSHDSESCAWINVTAGDENLCFVTNEPAPVDVVITKEWVIEGPGGDDVDTSYKLTLHCSGRIVDGEVCDSFNSAESPAAPPNLPFCKDFYGTDSQTFTGQVTPSYPNSICWVEETVHDSSVEIDNDCGSIVISAGQGDSCLITNTVFFEGIPTLNQYGLALLALLMMGVGLVGFRRFV